MHANIVEKDFTISEHLTYFFFTLRLACTEIRCRRRLAR